MFESRARLAEDIRGLLEALRREARGRYACLLEPSRVLFETPQEGGDPELRRLLESRSAEVFAIPAGLAADTPMEDVFAGWEQDEFLLAIINGRVAVVVACPDAELVRREGFDLLRALADRLFRYDERYRLDEKGRGLFVGRPRIDVVAMGSGRDAELE